MEGSGMSAGDILALTKDKDGFLEGNGIIILILFFLIFGFGGNGFGGGNALTQAELQAGLYNQTTDANLRDIRTALCNTDMNIMQNRYDNALQTQTLSSQFANCCCENKLMISEQTNALSNAIHSEGEATRALLTQNRINELEYQLTQANAAVSNAVQTQNILGSIGRFVPYAGYGYVNGCGCMNGTVLG